MIKIYNANFKDHRQRFIQAIIIGIASALASAFLMAFLARMLGTMNTIFDIAIAFIVSFAIKEGARSVEQRTLYVGGACILFGMLMYQYFYIFWNMPLYILIQPFEVFKLWITMWFSVSFNGLLALLIRCMVIVYGANNCIGL